MAYAACMEDLLETLRARVPAKVDTLAREQRQVFHGLLSVGIKLHCLGDEDLFDPLIDALGGKGRVIDGNVFRRSQGKFCLVLPPVGSARAAVLLLECIEQYTGCRVFLNPNIQLQVCSPGRLNYRNASLHAIGFYLSSDTLRQYTLADFATTASADHYHNCGKRLVIYDGGSYGEFDRSFTWWGRNHGGLAVRSTLPFYKSRTDIMVGAGSKIDIHNINLLATLLLHAQSDGYWSSLGELFARDLVSLLDRHLLVGLIDAPWVSLSHHKWLHLSHRKADSDQSFLSALQELTAYAAAEVARLQQARAASVAPGILFEVQELIATYRAIITSIAGESMEWPDEDCAPTGIGPPSDSGANS